MPELREQADDGPSDDGQHTEHDHEVGKEEQAGVHEREDQGGRRPVTGHSRDQRGHEHEDQRLPGTDPLREETTRRRRTLDTPTVVVTTNADEHRGGGLPRTAGPANATSTTNTRPRIGTTDRRSSARERPTIRFGRPSRRNVSSSSRMRRASTSTAASDHSRARRRSRVPSMRRVNHAQGQSRRPSASRQLAAIAAIVLAAVVIIATAVNIVTDFGQLVLAPLSS